MPKRLPYEMMTKKEYMKVHRDFRGTLKTPRIVKLDDDPESPSYLGTISKPVKFIDESGNLLVDLKSKMPKWKKGRGYTSKKEMEIKLSKYNPFASGRRDVFTKDVIDTYIEFKIENEINPINLRPHPYEMHLYYDA